MTWLEIIHLRSSGEPIAVLTGSIQDSIAAAGGDKPILTLYRRQGLATDLAVHVLHADTSAEAEPSDFGLRLASELRAYGLVEHTIWEELR